MSRKPKAPAEVKRFRLGVVYEGRVIAWRWRGERSDLIAVISPEELRDEIKYWHDDLGEDFPGYEEKAFRDVLETYAVVEYNGVEYAVDESELDYINKDHSGEGPEDVFTPADLAEFSAKRAGRTVELVVPCPPEKSLKVLRERADWQAAYEAAEHIANHEAWSCATVRRPARSARNGVLGVIWSSPWLVAALAAALFAVALAIVLFVRANF